tara:strand:+ start:4372 stop:5508 length:1137 start_codon:yes stop_codon:yes gene_type:complete
MDINVTAPVNELGYGVAGLNILKSIVALGHKAAFWPLGQPTVKTIENLNVLKECTANVSKYNPEAPSLRIWHQHDMAQHVGDGEKIGFPIFELDQFNDTEKHHLKNLDTIIVCSEWAKSVVKSQLPDSEVFVAPLGVDRSIFNPNIDTNNSNLKFANRDKVKTIFLNMGKWEVRKGHDILADAFCKAFKEEDEVELWMINENPFLKEEQQKEWHDLYDSCDMHSRIRILPRLNTHEDVAVIMSQADVGVFPSRAEGWNLEALEMLSMGKHLIITDYSAHTEFCNKDNSRLIQIDEMEDAHDGIWFHGQGQWASIGDNQIDQLVNHMREIHESREEVNHSGIETANLFSWDACARKIMNVAERNSQSKSIENFRRVEIG